MITPEQAMAIYHAGQEKVVQVICELSARVEELERKVAGLEAKNAELKRKVAKLSKNSASSTTTA